VNGVQKLQAAGVSVWLDDLGRTRIRSGELAQLVATGVSGVTTNPTIFAKAIGNGEHYRDDLRRLAAAGATPQEALHDLVISDVSAACDVLRPVYDTTEGVDGRVSIEVDPALAHDLGATNAQAAALWEAVARPNVMIKIPATEAGLPAITAALARGISVNVTLIFALDRYREVIDAWLTGLEAAQAAGHDLATIGSVASFFVSRVDTMVDGLLGDAHPELHGTAALANARLAYRDFADTLAGSRWQRLAESGARPQRPLWASTSTKNPAYPDTLYVDGLVAAHTVNTMPSATLSAVVSHDRDQHDTVTAGYAAAEDTMVALAEAGIDYATVVRDLEDQGVASFTSSWDDVRDAVGEALKTADRPA